MNFIERANQIHNHKYDYSKVTSMNNKENIEIICKEHGSFFPTWNNHLHGVNPTGCPKCANLSRSNKLRKYNTENYISLCKEIHPKYDYSKTIYISMLKTIIVICPEHGEFTPFAGNHYHKKTGCTKCGEIKKSRSQYEDYIEYYLLDKQIYYEREKRFNTLVNPLSNKQLCFDFWIPDISTIIEYQGEHHYKPVNFTNSFGFDKYDLYQLTLQKDELKHQFCLNNDINLITISYQENTFDKVFNYLDSSLCKL